jgi:hypothetical protein
MEPLTDKEKYDMYMKLSQEEVVKMFIEYQRIMETVVAWPKIYDPSSTGSPFMPPFTITCKLAQ